MELCHTPYKIIMDKFLLTKNLERTRRNGNNSPLRSRESS
jgi:hypothetical protein